jgi:transmembrane sensor
MSDSFDWRVIDRHLAGEASPEDARALEAWLARDPRNAALLNAVRASGRVLDRHDEGEWNVDRAWSRVAARMQDPRDAGVIPLPVRGSSRAAASARMKRAALAAGAIAAAAVVAVILTHRGAPHPDAARASRRLEVVAAVAQQTRVTLRDGTRVVLNAGSRLRYADDFGRADRDVELDGEGYFDVVHDDARPFRVHARGSVAQDVGTRFVVRAYPEQRAVDVVVVHGAVSLHGEGVSSAPALLAAGQHGRVEPTGMVTVVSEADVDRWTEWTRGGVVLDGMTLGDAALELGRRFGVRVEVRGEGLSRRRVSARFHDEPLPRVLDALGVALGARWMRDGERVVITAD